MMSVFSNLQVIRMGFEPMTHSLEVEIDMTSNVNKCHLMGVSENN
jgi:hypothetical protein